MKTEPKIEKNLQIIDFEQERKDWIRLERNKKIKENGKATREKRKGQKPFVYELKIVKSKLSKKILKDLTQLFIEAKWLSNAIIGSEDIFKFSDKTKVVEIKVGDKIENREIKTLGSHLKQSLLENIKEDISNLSKKKKKGQKVGKLKFKRYVKTIELKQYNNTYKIDGNKIKIQGIKKWLTVRGIDQLTNKDTGNIVFDIANAELIHRGGDFYLHVVCYDTEESLGIKKEKQDKRDYKKLAEQPEGFISALQLIGIDLGIKSQLFLSNGTNIEYRIETNRHFRCLCQKLSRAKLHSANWFHIQKQIDKQFLHTTNKKKNIAKQIINILDDEFSEVVYQNDNLQGWQHIWGKRMLSTALGGLITDLRKSETTIEVDRFFASTQTCCDCDYKQNAKIGLEQRIFSCKKCKLTIPRDWNSALCILKQGMINENKPFVLNNYIGAECTDFKPMETTTSTRTNLIERLNAISGIQASIVNEVGTHMHGVMAAEATML